MTATLVTQRQTSVRGFKNRFINGGFKIDTRNGFAAQSIGFGGSPAYCADRWIAYVAGSNEGSLVQGQCMGDGTYRFLAVTGTTLIDLAQRIESKNIKDLVGRVVTVSFDVSNTYKTTVYWEADYANSLDDFSSTTGAVSGQIDGVTSTLTRRNIQFTVPSGAVNGLQFYFYVTNQTYGYFTIGNVQLEDGPSMTDFEFRPHQLELLMCEYYARWVPFNITFWAYAASEALECPILWSQMRVTPTIGSWVSDPAGTPAQTNVAGSGFVRITPCGGAIYLQAAATGQCYALFYRTLMTAEL